jgi:glutathione S-transferase
MDDFSRASKLAEIWKQLAWLEENISKDGPYMTGDKLTHADLTWFPTAIFMEFMLPRVFDWPQIFHEKDHFPKLTLWFETNQKNDIFGKVHNEIFSFWV